MFDIHKIRAEFPILSQTVNGKPLVYFDNGATSQKPQVVIDAYAKYYSEINANIHRGVHTLSQLATDAYEESRRKIAASFKKGRSWRRAPVKLMLPRQAPWASSVACP